MTRAKDISKILTDADISGNIDVDGVTNLDVVDIDGAVDMATTLAVGGNVDFNGDLDVDGTTNLDVVDIDGAVDMASTLQVDGATTLSSGLVMTSNDPTITMTDSSGTNDISTIQSTSGALIFTARDGSADGEIIFKRFDGSTTDESMRIKNYGSLLVGTTNASPAEGTDNGVRIGSNGTSQFSSNGDAGISVNRTGDDGNVMTFRRDGNLRGRIEVGSTSTSYVTTSDYRLKENVNYNFDATSRLKQLKPARFNFIADADTTVDGFMAHEVSSIVPEAISGKKDAMMAEVLYVDGDEIPDGKKVGDIRTASQIDPQGIDQSKIVPLLTKTILELEARITALESA